MLERNTHGITAWQVSINDDGSACFSAGYHALTPGLNASVFRMICQLLLREAGEFDERIRRQGRLTLVIQPVSSQRVQFLSH